VANWTDLSIQLTTTDGDVRLLLAFPQWIVVVEFDSVP
jgi:hypothetical protein